MELSDIIAEAERVPGHMMTVELTWLSLEAKSLKPRCRWIEVGVLTGRSLMATGLSLPEASQLVAVDHHLMTAEYEGRTLAATLQRLLELRPDLLITLVRGDSLEALRRIPWFFDRVFIDAGHQYAITLQEIQAYRRRLNPAGRIIGHDYNPESWPGVVQAVDELGGGPVGAASIWAVP